LAVLIDFCAEKSLDREIERNDLCDFEFFVLLGRKFFEIREICKLPFA